VFLVVVSAVEVDDLVCGYYQIKREDIFTKVTRLFESLSNLRGEEQRRGPV
jgi:hypothetical protein